MKKIIDYFKEISYVALDKKTKKILYNSISHKIRKQESNIHGLSRYFHVFKTHAFSIMLSSILMITALFGTYLSLPYIQFGPKAQAEYLGTIISRNGSYQLVGGIDKSQKNISEGVSLIVSSGSEVSLRTTNNAITKIIGPAKLQFNKENNQIILNVAYSTNVHVSQGVSNEILSKTTDILVVKTETKTIIGTTPQFELTIAAQSGLNQLLTSNLGEINISSKDGKDSIVLAKNDTVVLDDELSLFSKPIATDILASSPQKNDKVNIETTDNIPGMVISLKQESGESAILSTDEITYLQDIMIEVNQTGTSVTGVVVDSLTGSDTETGLLLLSDNMELIEEEHVLESLKKKQNIDDVSDTRSLDDIYKNEQKLNELLDVKPILDGRILELLDKMYEIYYYSSGKNITSIASQIQELCGELKVKYMEDNLIGTLNQINAKIINTYIITPDIKLIQ